MKLQPDLLFPALCVSHFGLVAVQISAQSVCSVCKVTTFLVRFYEKVPAMQQDEFVFGTATLFQMNGKFILFYSQLRLLKFL